MKKLLKFSLLIFIPIIIGFALLLSGIFAANEGIRYAGIMTMTIGVPVCMLIVVVTGLVLMITGRNPHAQSEHGRRNSRTAQFGRYGTARSYGYERKRTRRNRGGRYKFVILV